MVTIEDDLMEGEPLRLERTLLVEAANALLKFDGKNYENTCDNLRLLADVIEEIEEHINDKHIKFVYNPMGAWVRVEEKEEK